MIDRWTPVTDPRPFTHAERVPTVLPYSDDSGEAASIAALTSLLRNEAFELEVELGAPPVFVDDVPDDVDTPRCLIGPAIHNPTLRRELRALAIPDSSKPFVWIDRARHLVMIDGPDLNGVTTALQLLRSATRSGAILTVPESILTSDAVIDHLRTEIAATYPAFALRGIDWAGTVERHVPAIRAANASVRSLQELVAELGDAHTWVRPTITNARLPYRAWASGDHLYLTHVPRWSFGWRFGARPGDELLASNVASWRRRTSASARTLPVMIPYRMLSGTFGRARRMRVRKPDGWEVNWAETYQTLPWREPMAWDRLPSGTGYLRLRGWLSGDAWNDMLDAALRDLARYPRLIVDLRGNVGGSLIAAQGFRDRFLTGRTALGAIAFSRGDGTLSPRASIVGVPSDAARWSGPVRFLVDRQSYSATEDALLGLQGLPHVQVVGEPTGGGSGRPRTLRLNDRISASVSTALTFDRHGTCIEGRGIPVDMALPIATSLVEPERLSSRQIIGLADTGW